MGYFRDGEDYYQNADPAQAPTEKLKALLAAVMECRPYLPQEELQRRIEEYLRLESELSVVELQWLIDNFDRLLQAKLYHARMIREKQGK